MMKVRELIALLQTFDQELPVTSYHGGEDTGFVTPKGVRLKASADWEDTENPLWGHADFAPITSETPTADSHYYTGLYVDIMGF